jgi:2-keto-3-deoxy-L-rhamnonate aldolase RhmA
LTTPPTDRRPLFRDLRERLEQGPLLAAWASIGHPAVATILARSGVDLLVLDAEHGMFTHESISACLTASQSLGLPTLVRVPANEQTAIKLILDLGPDGVVVPMVNDGRAAADAVASCLYPPAGRRGFGAGRAAGYGIDYPEYQATANSHLAVVLQIEHVDAVANVDEIARTPGVTALFVGPTDLSASMGLMNQSDHPDMLAAITKVIQAGAAAGVPVGMFCSNEAQAVDRIARGARFVAWTNDLGLLAKASAASVETIRPGLR